MQAQDIEYICEAGPSRHRGTIQSYHRYPSIKATPKEHYRSEQSSHSFSLRSNHAPGNKSKGRIRISPISSVSTSSHFTRLHSSIAEIQNDSHTTHISIKNETKPEKRKHNAMKKVEKEVERVRKRYAPTAQNAFTDELGYLIRLFIALNEAHTSQILSKDRPRMEELCLSIAQESLDFCERYKDAEIADENQQFKFECLRVQAIASTEGAKTAFDALESILYRYSSIIDSIRSGMSLRSKQIDLNTKELFNSVLLALQQIMNACYFQDINNLNEVARRMLLNVVVLDLFSNSSPAFRGRYNDFLSRIDSPLQFITSLVAKNTKDVKQMIEPVDTLLNALSSGGRHREAFQIYMWADQIGIDHKTSISKRLIIRLNQKNEQNMADDVEKIMQMELPHAKNDTSKDSAQRLSAIRCAKRGDSRGLEDILNVLSYFAGRDTKNKEEFAYRMRLINASIRGEVEGCIALMETRYDFGEIVHGLVEDSRNDHNTGEMQLKPEAGPEQYRILIKALLKSDKVGEAELVIDRMTEKGIQVPKGVWIRLLRDYVRRNDLSSAIPLFEDLSKQGYPGDAAFLAMLSLFARKGDVENAGQIVQLALSQNFQEKVALYNGLLHAHIEARSWQGAAKLFETMLVDPDPSIRPNQRSYTTMLQAHVAQRMPIQKIIAFFRNMIKAGFTPDAHIFTVLLSSAWDARIAPIAEQLFTMAEKMLGGKGNKTHGKGATAHHFTVMIRGYLAIHDGETAKSYFDELEARKLPIDGTLARIIVEGYVREESVDETLEEYDEGGNARGLAAAQELANHFSQKLPSEYITIQWPLLRYATMKGDSFRIRTIIQGMIDRSIEVPVEAWTNLMGAFRRNEDVDNTLRVWDVVFSKALEREEQIALLPFITKKVANQDQNSEIRVKASMRHVLCAPLSEIILALRDARRPDEVAKIWTECRQYGFAFDSHNWNHLATTLLQSGRILDACDIVERVLNVDPPRYWSEELQMLAYERALEAYRKDKQAKRLTKENENDQDITTASDRFAFEGQTEALFGEEEEIEKRSQSGQKIERHLFRFPADDPYVEIPEDSQDNLVPSSEPVIEAEQDVESANLDVNEMMGPLIAQKALDKIRSPWFAHFETMAMLKEIIDEGEDQGGVIKLHSSDDSQVNDGFARGTMITVRQLLETHPRTKQLLLLFERTLEDVRRMDRRRNFKDRTKLRVPRYPVLNRGSTMLPDSEDPNNSSLGYGVVGREGNHLEEEKEHDEYDEEERFEEEEDDNVRKDHHEEEEEEEGDWRSKRL